MKHRILIIALMATTLLVSGCAHNHHGEYVTDQRAHNIAKQVYAEEWPSRRLEVLAIAESAADDAVQAASEELTQTLQNLATLQSPIIFSFGDAFLLGYARQQLDRKIAIMKAHPEVGLIMIGRADAPGSKQANLALSMRRAHVAREYMVAGGVSRDRLAIVPRGEADSQQKQASDRVVAFHAVMLKDMDSDPVTAMPVSNKKAVMEALRKQQAKQRESNQ